MRYSSSNLNDLFRKSFGAEKTIEQILGPDSDSELNESESRKEVRHCLFHLEEEAKKNYNKMRKKVNELKIL